ncbi:hypothetical protein C3L33_14318, partial [Rhododendron williamsianum]
MARRAGGECIQQRSPKRADDFDQPSSASQELHVLAVDDSHVDRKESSHLREIPVVIMSSENILARIDSRHNLAWESGINYIIIPHAMSIATVASISFKNGTNCQALD